jgi:hypothetical protein
MDKIIGALSKLGIGPPGVHSHAEGFHSHDAHTSALESQHGIVARTVLLKDKKGRPFLCIMHPSTELSCKILSTRLGCGKGGVAEASEVLTQEMFGSQSSVVTLGCILDCSHCLGILLDQELKTEFWVGAAQGSGSIFLDGFHVSQLLSDRNIQMIDFAANPKIDRENPPDLKSFADAVDPLPEEFWKSRSTTARWEASRPQKGAK